MIQDLKEFLKTTVLFQDLQSAQLDKIVKVATEKSYAKYHVVFEEGETGDALYIIRSGLVKISKESSDGRTKTLALLTPGEVFGEMAVLSDEGRSANAETLADTVCVIIAREDFTNLIEKNSSIAMQIIRTLSERLVLADRQIKNLALGNSRAKIADLLMQLSKEFGAEGEDGTRVNVRLTHQELADLAGLARETTTKMLNEFVKDEAILLKDREIEIIDKEKLGRWVA